MHLSCFKGFFSVLCLSYWTNGILLSDSAFAAGTRTICPILTTVLQSLLLPFFPSTELIFNSALLGATAWTCWRSFLPKRFSSLRFMLRNAVSTSLFFLDRARYWSLSELHQLVHLTLSSISRFSLLPVWSCWSYSGSHCQSHWGMKVVTIFAAVVWRCGESC